MRDNVVDKYTFIDIGEYYGVYLNGKYKDCDDDYYYLFYCSLHLGNSNGFLIEEYEWKDHSVEQPEWCWSGIWPDYLSDIDLTKFKKRC